MKTFSVAYAAHVAGGRTTLAVALRIVRPDGRVFAFTTHDESAEIDGVSYSANPGLTVSDIITNTGTGVGTLELRTLNDSSVFTPADVFNGLWKNSSFLLFRYSWEDPSIAVDYLLSGNVGEVLIRDEEIVAELRDLRQHLHEPVGAASSKTCRARLGDARCGKSLTSFTHSGAITSVTSSEVFADSGRGEASDYFGEGEIEITSGENVGVTRKVHTFAAGVFTVAVPFFAPLQAGDTYVAIAGCRKRYDEDCVGKFSNGRRFVGEPHRRGLNDLMKRSPE